MGLHVNLQGKLILVCLGWLLAEGMEVYSCKNLSCSIKARRGRLTNGKDVSQLGTSPYPPSFPSFQWK